MDLRLGFGYVSTNIGSDALGGRLIETLFEGNFPRGFEVRGDLFFGEVEDFARLTTSRQFLTHDIQHRINLPVIITGELETLFIIQPVNPSARSLKIVPPLDLFFRLHEYIVHLGFVNF